MTFAAWLPFLLICCLGAMSPGPSLAVVLKQTVNNGRLHGLVTSWFHAAGVGLWALATVSGLAVLLEQSQTVYLGITWAGAAYLAWLGLQALFSKAQGALEVEKSAPVSLWKSGIEGAMISVLNPKLAIFFIALFSQFISPDASLSDHLIIISTATLVDGLWYTLVALVLSHGTVLAALQRRSLVINRVTGIVLLGLALRVVTL